MSNRREGETKKGKLQEEGQMKIFTLSTHQQWPFRKSDCLQRVNNQFSV